MNVFKNTYSAPENRLTYNFLCTIDLMTEGQRDLLQFLLHRKGIQLSASPIIDIRPLFAFAKGSDPDGCIKVRRTDGAALSVFMEVKTIRLSLTPDQVQRHIKYHVGREADALLLVITPRPSDAKIVQAVKDDRIIFVSWQEIADYLSKKHFGVSDRKIIDQFLEHSGEEGEFMPTELEKEDISLIIDCYRRRPEERLRGAFERLGAEFKCDRYLTLKQAPYWRDEWGRKGINLTIEAEKGKERWISFGIYYDTRDHGIPFQEDVPELALFVDINPGFRNTLNNVPEFVGALGKLEQLGWEENLTKPRTSNLWRLLYWRKPLSGMGELNSEILGGILGARLGELTADPPFLQNYTRQHDSPTCSLPVISIT